MEGKAPVRASAGPAGGLHATEAAGNLGDSFERKMIRKRSLKLNGE